MSINHVFAIAGAKGGVGKTTNSLNLGTALAMEGRETVVVEADLAMANAIDFLDVDADIESEPTLHDVLAGTASVAEATYDAPDGIDLVPSGVNLDGFAAAEPDQMGAVVEELRSSYEVIILDTGAGLNPEMLIPMGLADQTIVTSTPRVASVRDVEKTIELAERADGDVRGIVFTKSGTGKAPPPDRISEFLDVEMLGHVPEDEAVPTAQDAGRTVTAHAPNSEAAKAYREIASVLDEEIEPDRPTLSADRATSSSRDSGMSKLIPGGGMDEQEAEERMVLTDTPATDGGEPNAALSDSPMGSGEDKHVETPASPASAPTLDPPPSEVEESRGAIDEGDERPESPVTDEVDSKEAREDPEPPAESSDDEDEATDEPETSSEDPGSEGEDELDDQEAPDENDPSADETVIEDEAADETPDKEAEEEREADPEPGAETPVTDADDVPEETSPDEEDDPIGSSPDHESPTQDPSQDGPESEEATEIQGPDASSEAADDSESRSRIGRIGARILGVVGMFLP